MSRSSSLFAALLVCAPALAQQTQVPLAGDAGLAPQTAPYRTLDTVEGHWLDLALLPVRPLARDPQNDHLYALDAHGDQVVEFDETGAHVRSLQTPWGPVALAYWEPQGGGLPSLLVATRGSYTLARIDLTSGAIVGLVALPTEPADVVVHPSSNRAFVSCSGDDSVVEVDLELGAIVARHAIPSKRPTFLALDGADVLVAPMLSGNNSMADTGPNILDVGPGRVLDLEDPLQAQSGLADHDLFRITPAGAVEALATDMGAVLFGVGVNPASGQVWQLGTEAINKDPLLVGEPAVRGRFIVNQLARVALSPGSVVTPLAVHDLDDSDPGTAGVQYDAARSVGQPYALAFDSSGAGYVTGLLSDNVTQLSPTGSFVREWNVGSIPRGILVDANGTSAAVHCWGANTVELYDLAPATPTLVATLDLGYDPTPALHKQGRQLFFDGSRSMHGNASCASCHIETEADLLVWDLSNMPYDDKGPLVTQTMRGIADLVPFHWRGERAELLDFNGAFDGLLGNAPLTEGPGGEFEAFQAYVFSLEQPANPNQDPRRLVADFGALTSPGGVQHRASAVRGQDLYFDENAIVGFGSCNLCHTLPTGTSNEVTLDEPDLEVPRRNHFAVASFNGMWRKEQPTLETVVLASGASEQRPTLGSGVSASGLKDGILDFVNISLFNGLDQQERNDISAFVEQVDSGLAPSVHGAWLLDATDAGAVAGRLAGFLLPQAAARHCDVAVFGTVDVGGGTVAARWVWDRASGLFLPDDSSLGARDLAFFVAQAQAGTGSNVFFGAPVGMGARLAVDADLDGLFDGDELALGSDPFDPDTDGDGDPDGHEVDEGGDALDDQNQSNDTTAPTISNARVVYVTNQVAKLQFDTDEPCTFVASWVSGSFSGGTSSAVLATNHTVLLTDVRRHNKSHTVTLDAFDIAGNTSQTVLGGVTTLGNIPNPTTAFRDPTLATLQDSGGTLSFTLRGKARRIGGGPEANRQLRVQVFVNGVLTQANLLGTTSTGDGFSTATIVESGLTVGDVVEVTVFTLYDVGAQDGATWSFPDTPPENRQFAQTYTGNGP